MAPRDSERIVTALILGGLALALARGGWGDPARVAGTALAVAALAVSRPAARDVGPIGLGLAVAGLGALAGWAAHRPDASLPWALSACAPACWYVAVRARPAAAAMPAAVGWTAIAAVSACGGVLALALRRPPMAEAIDGVWRAGGTFQYPPALALACLFALLLVGGLALAGALDRQVAGALAVAPAVGLVATFDRFAIGMAILGLAWFGIRLPSARRTAIAAAAALTGFGLVAVMVAHPGRSDLAAHLSHSTLASRIDLWRDAAGAVRRSPLTGTGPGNYAAVYRPEPHDRTVALAAHDAVLQAAVEGGAVAGLGTLVAVAGIAVAAIRALAARDPLRLAWGCCAAAGTISVLLDFTGSFPPLMLLLVLAAARAGVRPDSVLGTSSGRRSSPTLTA